MKLLVSVSNADEARSAVLGGADIIDAKDPSMGALGAVGLDAFARIRASRDSVFASVGLIFVDRR